MATVAKSFKLRFLAGIITAASINSTSLAVPIDVLWINPQGGSFNDPLNWLPETVPGAADIASFDIGATYPISYSQNITTATAAIDGDFVTFNLSGFTYTVSNLFVGEHIAEVGQLAVVGGHMFNNGIGLTRVGVDFGSDGELLVTSTGTVTALSTLLIGDAGVGALTIQPGGTVNSAAAFVGDDAGAVGTVLVSGPNAQWNLTGSLMIASNGTGTLTVENGAIVSGLSASAGDNTDSNGSMLVTGNATQLNLSGNLVIGNDGTGDMTVDSGASVSNVTASIGDNTGAIGTMLVTGSTTQWNLSANLIVANDGTGALTVANGAGVTAQGLLKVGDLVNSSGSIIVTGAGSNLTSNGGVSLGNNKIGTLSITNGGTVEHHIGLTRIGNNVGSNGSINVAGPGSAWNCSTEAFIGNFGVGSLSIDNAAAANTTRVKVGDEIGSTGTATINGKGSLWSDSVEIFVGNFGTGTATVSNGAQVSANATTIGDDPGSAGVITVDGPGSTWSSSSSFTNGHLGSGGLQISDNGNVQVGSYMQSAAGTLDVQIGPAYVTSVNSSGNAQLSGSLTLSLAAGFTPAGGQQFTIVSANSRNGTFTQINAPADLEVSYDANSVIVTFTGGQVCVGDLDNNGSVGTSDLLILFSQWGTAGSADLDGNGSVGTSDLLILFTNWGPCN